MEDEYDETYQPPTVPSSPELGKAKQVEKSSREAGCSFDELVDRLLALPMSKQDAKFAAIFLCLYRKFAAPPQLLSAVLARFEKIEKSGAAQLTRVGDQLRHLNIMEQWVSEYPGDFAHPNTRKMITNFIAKLEKNRVYAFAAKDMSQYLEVVVEDDDTGWACYDKLGLAIDNVETFLHTASVHSSASTHTAKSSSEELTKEGTAVEAREEVKEASPRHSSTPSHGSSTGRSGSTSNQSLTALLTLEGAQREAQQLNPIPRHPLSKIQWHQFMDIPDEDFARELTRIDWIMYCSIRPRDLVRHVSLTGEQKDNSKSLENVTRMIGHFNHLAFFVASMVLLRDKPKHRAKALEKFMGIAWVSFEVRSKMGELWLNVHQKLRQQNNYNSLGAIIAGINGTALHRLAQTRELVPHQVQKAFMRLVILMGTQKSHFAYRLAWENSFSERIPFLPLHRRDLVSAEEGNRTFVGENEDRINWKKFEVMGETVIGIQRSQGTPYAFRDKNEQVQRMILEAKFGEDDDVSFEPSDS